MKKANFIKTLIAAAVLFSASCSFYERRESAVSAKVVAVDAPPATNILDGAVENYRADIDYFPDKAVFTRAGQLAVEYGKNYKRVRFRSNTTGEEIRYILVQRGTPAPDLPELKDKGTRLVYVPVNRFAQSGWRYGGVWDLLGVVPRLVAVPGSRVITTPSIRARIDAGELREDFGEEVLLESDAEAVFDVYNGGVQSYIQRKYYEIGLEMIQMAEPLETEPLAKTEWIKFAAMFFNREKQANDYFARVEREYETLKVRVAERRASSDAPRPRVMVNHFNGGVWNIYGERNAFAQLIRDAGGDYRWSEAAESYAPIVGVGYEAAYDRALEADVWIVGPDFSSRFAGGDPLFDERIRKLPIARSGRFYVSFNPDENKRNPYWDRALINPHLELADYVKAIHPEILPAHEFVFLRNLIPKN